MTRYYAESPCVHGEIREHRTGPFKAGGKTSWGTCAGVTRRELTIDYERADAAFRIALATKGIDVEDLPTFVVAQAIVLAALGDPE